MHRSLTMQSRGFTSLIVAAGLSLAAAALACPNGKDSGVSASIPTNEPDVVLAGNTSESGGEAATPAPTPHARFKETDHLLDHPMSWLFLVPGQKSVPHGSAAERVSRAVDHKSLASASPRGTHVPARHGRSAGDFEARVGRPHRMPGPEIL